MPRTSAAATGLPAIDTSVGLVPLDAEGTGAPTIAGYLGQRYWRLDTPGTTNQRLYVCTVAGAAGAATWVGIL